MTLSDRAMKTVLAQVQCKQITTIIAAKQNNNKGSTETPEDTQNKKKEALFHTAHRFLNTQIQHKKILIKIWVKTQINLHEIKVKSNDKFKSNWN